MSAQAKLRWVFDWTLGEEEFRAQVRGMLSAARERGKVISLPIHLPEQPAALEIVSAIISQVDCTGCDAPCCRSNPNNAPLYLSPKEQRRLAAKYPQQLRGCYPGQLRMPCPFLKDSRCSIYGERPLACTLYPFQFGAEDEDRKQMIALESRCPQACVIVERVFIAQWALRRALVELR